MICNLYLSVTARTHLLIRPVPEAQLIIIIIIIIIMIIIIIIIIIMSVFLERFSM